MREQKDCEIKYLFAIIGTFIERGARAGGVTTGAEFEERHLLARVATRLSNGDRTRVCVAFAGVDHEGGYRLDATRRFTLAAITRIAQSVKGTPLEYKA